MPNTHKSGNVALWGIFLVIVIGVLVAAVMYGNSQEAPGQTDIAIADEQKNDILAVREDDNIKGSASAPVVIVEYSDFQCPACKNFAPVIESVLENNPEGVAFVYRHLPLRQIHPNADLAARASQAAANQGKFFEMHDLLFAEQENWSAERNPRNLFVEYADSLELDLDLFATDLNSPEIGNRVNSDYQDAELLLGGQRGLSTPTIFVNGEQIQGQSLSQLNAIVTALIEATESEASTTTSELNELPTVTN